MKKFVKYTVFVSKYATVQDIKTKILNILSQNFETQVHQQKKKNKNNKKHNIIDYDCLYLNKYSIYFDNVYEFEFQNFTAILNNYDDFFIDNKKVLNSRILNNKFFFFF
jgi:hypothetical protein